MIHRAIATMARTLIGVGNRPELDKDTGDETLLLCPPWRHVFASKSCVVIGVADEGMAPTLPNGSSVLVDLDRREWQPRSIVALRIDGCVIARRAGADRDGGRVLAHDNPAWPDRPLPAGAEVVGQVVCLERGVD